MTLGILNILSLKILNIILLQLSVHPNLRTDDVELLKIKTKDDQLKELHYKTEKHDSMKIY